ncbi:MAG TPA: hypothetical protein DCK87_01310 [Desulfotomaculum sp.]|nr:hypothetical protein [Desulfotomaculum sp.]
MFAKYGHMSEKPVISVAIDTNVLVPSLYSRTPIARFILSGKLTFIWNPFIHNEASKIINRLADRYYKKAGVQSEEIIKLLELITDLGIEVPDMPDDWPSISSDRNDDPFLWAALTGGAEYIISDDESHMLKLKEFCGIPIGTPGDFFEWVKIAHPIPKPRW